MNKILFTSLLTSLILGCGSDDEETDKSKKPAAIAYYWNMDNASISSNMLQSIVGNVDGTIVEAIAGVGMVGEALLFDGINDFVTFGDTGDNLFSGPKSMFSITMWIKPLKNHTYGQVFGKTADSSCPENQRQTSLQIHSTANGNNFPRFGYQTLSGSQSVGLLSDVQLPTDTWSHLAITYDGSINSSKEGRVNIYVDGQISTITVDGGKGSFPFDIQNGTAHLSLGDLVDSNGQRCKLKTDNAFNGEIDEFVIWEGILTNVEINNVRQNNIDGNPLVL